jgi:SagB-type dehydrogenase family enzyme
MKLPQPRLDSNFSLEKAISQRRSVRGFGDNPITLDELSQLLWAAQGVTHVAGLRAAPSAGTLFPMELYVVAGNVVELEAGVYKYQSQGHELFKLKTGDVRKSLTQAAADQSTVAEAAASIVIMAAYEQMLARYGERGTEYTAIEAGHVSQNIYLQATALGLGTVALGAFIDNEVNEILEAPARLMPLYIMPVGRSV